MLITPIDECYDRFAVEIIKTTADEGKAFCREILHFGRKIDFAIEPWLDGVLIGGSDIDQVSCEQRTDMICNHLVGDAVPVTVEAAEQAEPNKQ